MRWLKRERLLEQDAARHPAPPNAIVFAIGQVPQAAMVRCGLWKNLMCTAVIAAWAFAAFGLRT